MEIPELEFADDEAKELAEAVTRVSDLYDKRLNPKALAWTHLAMALGSIYGPRVWAIKNRWEKEGAGDQGITGKRAEPVDISGKRAEVRKSAPPEPQFNQPRSPADLFGLSYNGYIPDAM